MNIYFIVVFGELNMFLRDRSLALIHSIQSNKLYFRYLSMIDDPK